MIDLSPFRTVKVMFLKSGWGFPVNEKVEVEITSAGPGWAFVRCLEGSKIGIKAFILTHKNNQWHAGELTRIRVFSGERR